MSDPKFLSELVHEDRAMKRLDRVLQHPIRPLSAALPLASLPLFSWITVAVSLSQISKNIAIGNRSNSCLSSIQVEATDVPECLKFRFYGRIYISITHYSKRDNFHSMFLSVRGLACWNFHSHPNSLPCTRKWDVCEWGSCMSCGGKHDSEFALHTRRN